MQKRYIAAAGAALMTLTLGLAGCSSDTESTAAAETTTETTCSIDRPKGADELYVSVRARNSLGWGDSSDPRVPAVPLG